MKLNKLVAEIWWCWKPALNANRRRRRRQARKERTRNQEKILNIMTFNLTLISFLPPTCFTSLLSHFANAIKTLNFPSLVAFTSAEIKIRLQIEFRFTQILMGKKSLSLFQWKSFECAKVSLSRSLWNMEKLSSSIRIFLRAKARIWGFPRKVEIGFSLWKGIIRELWHVHMSAVLIEVKLCLGTGTNQIMSLSLKRCKAFRWALLGRRSLISSSKILHSTVLTFLRPPPFLDLHNHHYLCHFPPPPFPPSQRHPTTNLIRPLSLL